MEYGGEFGRLRRNPGSSGNPDGGDGTGSSGRSGRSGSTAAGGGAGGGGQSWCYYGEVSRLYVDGVLIEIIRESFNKWRKCGATSGDGGDGVIDDLIVSVMPMTPKLQ